MNDLKALLDLDFKYLFFGFCLILIVGKTLWITIEWLLIEKLGLETKKQKERREDEKLLNETSKLAKTTAEGLTKLESRHTKDEKEFRENLNKHMTESEKDRKTLHEEMKQYSENRIKDREQSMQIQKELTSSMAKLAAMFLDKEIDDMRWEILNFCASLSNGKKYNRESYAHVFSVYEKYERILDENNMENGLVEDSMAFIRERYQEDLKNGELK
jgi:seryl-tRNA synthetase